MPSNSVEKRHVSRELTIRCVLGGVFSGSLAKNPHSRPFPGCGDKLLAERERERAKFGEGKDRDEF